MTQNAPFLRVLSDIHGDSDLHLELIKDVPYSLQLGDLGFRYGYLEDAGVDVLKHRFFGGNHDNYDVINQSPFNMGDFGVWEVPELGPIFWVRGAWSIDWMHREKSGPRKSIWEEEELTEEKLQEAYELYMQVKPKVLITHTCPKDIINFVGSKEFAEALGYEGDVLGSRTEVWLQKMVVDHPPQYHLFGHFHCWFDRKIDMQKPPQGNMTRFICIRHNGGYIDLTKEFFDELKQS